MSTNRKRSDPMTRTPDDDTPKKLELPTDIHVNELDVRPPAAYVSDAVREVLPPGTEVALVSKYKVENQGRAAFLARFGYRPLRWSDLTKPQKRALERILPY